MRIKVSHAYVLYKFTKSLSGSSQRDQEENTYPPLPKSAHPMRMAMTDETMADARHCNSAGSDDLAGPISLKLAISPGRAYMRWVNDDIPATL